MLMAAGTPELAETKTRTIKEGDVEIDPDKQEAPTPPSLRNPGETSARGFEQRGRNAPRAIPQAAPDNTPGADPDEQSSTPPAAAQPGQPAPPSQTSASPSQPASPANGQPAQAAPAGTTPADSKQPPPAGSNQLVSTGTASAVTN